MHCTGNNRHRGQFHCSECDGWDGSRVIHESWRPANLPASSSHTREPWRLTGTAGQTFIIQAVVIILPSIGRDLEIPDSRLQWIVSAYSLAFGCFLLFWGRIADIYGMKRIFVWGTAWVALTSLINPFVTNEIAFDLLRGLQGLVRSRPTASCGTEAQDTGTDADHCWALQGAAANVPTALGILGTTFRSGKAKTYAFAAYGGCDPCGRGIEGCC